MKIHEGDIRNTVTQFFRNFTNSIFVKIVLLEVIDILAHFIYKVVIDRFAPDIAEVSLQHIECGLHAQYDKIHNYNYENRGEYLWVGWILSDKINDLLVYKGRNDFDNAKC